MIDLKIILNVIIAFILYKLVLKAFAHVILDRLIKTEWFKKVIKDVIKEKQEN